MISDPRRVATIDYWDVDSIVADATRLFGLTHRGLKPTAKVIRPLRGRLSRLDCNLDRGYSGFGRLIIGLYDITRGLCRLIMTSDRITHGFGRMIIDLYDQGSGFDH